MVQKEFRTRYAKECAKLGIQGNEVRASPPSTSIYTLYLHLKYRYLNSYLNYISTGYEVMVVRL